MKFDAELAELAKLLRVGAETARVIAGARGRDQAVILHLAAQADRMAVELDGILGGIEPEPPQPATLRLRRDR